MRQRDNITGRLLVAALFFLPLLCTACGDREGTGNRQTGGTAVSRTTEPGSRATKPGVTAPGGTPLLDAIPLDIIAGKAGASPERFSPSWPEGTAAAYTIAGAPLSEEDLSRKKSHIAFFGPDGSVEAPAGAPNITVWIYEPDSDRLYTPDDSGAGITLPQGYLPIPRARWKAGEEIEVQTQIIPLGADAAEGGSLFQYKVRLFNTGTAPREVRICLVVRSASLSGGAPRAVPVSLDGCDLLAGGRILCRCPADPKGLIEIPSATAGAEPSRAVCYDVMLAAGLDDFAAATPAREFSFLFPTGAPPSSWPDGKRLRKEFARAHLVWEDRGILDTIRFVSPDIALQNTWRAALSRLVLSAGPEGLGTAPGPDRIFRCLETASAAAALNRAGRFAESRALLASFDGVIRPDGGIPSAGESGSPSAESNGRALFALVDYFRFTHDAKWLREKEKTILAAAGFLADQTAGGLPERYADGFWALTGLKEAAWAAEELGRVGEAKALREQARVLGVSLLESIPKSMRDAGTAYIPSTLTPEDARLTPEDARLTPEDARLTPEDALANGAGAWPGDLLTFNDSWATRAFELYWNLWYEGSSGALQTGQGFLSAGMELGSPLLALRKRKYPDQILEWHAQHTTLKGAHTWATLLPAPSKAGGGVPLGGLAPSLRADAAYVTLMRNLFVMENGGYLFLFPGITLRWFEMEEELGVINAPTRYGSLSVRITTEGQKKTVIDFFDTTANPPKGYMLNQIIPSTSPQIRVDGQPYSHSKTDFLLILPAHAKRIEINW